MSLLSIDSPGIVHASYISTEHKTSRVKPWPTVSCWKNSFSSQYDQFHLLGLSYQCVDFIYWKLWYIYVSGLALPCQFVMKLWQTLSSSVLLQFIKHFSKKLSIIKLFLDLAPSSLSRSHKTVRKRPSIGAVLGGKNKNKQKQMNKQTTNKTTPDTVISVQVLTKSAFCFCRGMASVLVVCGCQPFTTFS